LPASDRKCRYRSFSRRPSPEAMSAVRRPWFRTFETKPSSRISMYASLQHIRSTIDAESGKTSLIHMHTWDAYGVHPHLSSALSDRDHGSTRPVLRILSHRRGRSKAITDIHLSVAFGFLRERSIIQSEQILSLQSQITTRRASPMTLLDTATQELTKSETAPRAITRSSSFDLRRSV